MTSRNPRYAVLEVDADTFPPLTALLKQLADRHDSPGCRYSSNFEADKNKRSGSFADGVMGLCSNLDENSFGCLFGECTFVIELRRHYKPERGWFIQHLNAHARGTELPLGHRNYSGHDITGRAGRPDGVRLV